MIRACSLALLAIVAGAEPATSDLFRCVEADGSTSYADRPELCAQPEAHRPRGRVQRVPTPAAPAENAVPGEDRGESSLASRLERALVPQSELGVAWEVVEEAPADTERDEDFVRWGVRSQRARHYTRHAKGIVQVCSVEIWGFANVLLARRAQASFAYPGWRIAREGPLLLMIRGLTRTPGEPPLRGVFADCQELGDRIQQRAARLVSD